MSAHEVGWVFRHSPATGAAFAVHLAIADSVNDQHEHEFWMRVNVLRAKARCSRASAQRAVTWLLDHEPPLLELCEGETRADASRPVRYRMLMPELPLMYDASRRRSGSHHDAPRGERVSRDATGGASPRDGEVSHHATGGASPRDPLTIATDRKTDRNANTTAASADDGGRLDVVETLCNMLADAISLHRGSIVNGEPQWGPRPRITKAWHQSMRLLIERGPLHVDKPEPVAPERVLQAIKVVFNDLAEPQGRDNFCWADQIQSATALRDHWMQLREAARRTTRTRQSAGATAVDRAAARLNGGTRTRQPLGLLPGD